MGNRVRLFLEFDSEEACVEASRKVRSYRNDTKQIQILNRIVEWTDRGILLEGDQRHVGICVRQMGPEESTREVMTPVDRSGMDPRDATARG